MPDRVAPSRREILAAAEKLQRHIARRMPPDQSMAIVSKWYDDSPAMKVVLHTLAINMRSAIRKRTKL